MFHFVAAGSSTRLRITLISASLVESLSLLSYICLSGTTVSDLFHYTFYGNRRSSQTALSSFEYYTRGRPSHKVIGKEIQGVEDSDASVLLSVAFCKTLN